MAFDPYHKWLAILPKDQPPNHYRLLGLEFYESDQDVIEGAADRAMAFIRQYQSGEHAALAAKLLNEIATARLCLLKPKAKSDYDAKLKKHLASLIVGKSENEGSTYSIDAALTELDRPSKVSLSAKKKVSRSPQKKSTSNLNLLVGGGIGTAVILVIGIMLLNRGEKPDLKPTLAKSSIAETKSPAVPEKQNSTEPVKETGRVEVASKSMQTELLPVVERAGPSIDLIPLVELTRDQDAGEWKKEGTSLSCSTGGNLYLPTAMPDDYQLQVKLKRTNGDDGISIGFLMAGRQALVAFDAYNSTVSGLFVDGHHCHQNSTTRPVKLFTNGIGADLVLTVHPGHFHAACDGQTVIDWHGNPDRMFIPPDHGIVNRETPYLVTSRGLYQFESIALTPIKPVPVTRIARLDKPFDVLPLVDAARDGIGGTWMKDGNGLTSPGSLLAKITLPVAAPEEYSLSAKVELLTEVVAQPIFTAGLAVGDSWCTIPIVKHDCLGIEMMNGTRWNANDSRVQGSFLFLHKPARLVWTVTRNNIRIDLDNRTLMKWKGDFERLSPQAGWAIADATKLMLATNTNFRISEVTIGPPIDPPGLPDHPLLTIGKPIDLIPLIDPKRDAIIGTWTLDEGVLRVMGDQHNSKLTVPFEVPAEYQLTMRVVREPGGATNKESLTINLPLASSMGMLHFDAFTSNLCALRLDGPPIEDPLNASSTKVEVISPDQVNEIVVTVRATGVKVSKGKTAIFNWIGRPDRSFMDLTFATLAGRIGIVSWDDRFRFEKLELTPLEPTSFPSVPELGSDGNLLAVIDIKRDSRKGEWKLDQNGLVSPTLEGAWLRLPVDVPQRYVLSAEVERRAGAGLDFFLGLIVGGKPCAVSIDGTLNAGLMRLDGMSFNDASNPTRRVYTTPLLPEGKTIGVRVYVLPDTVIMICGGKEVVRWHGDPRRLTLGDAFKPPNYSSEDRNHLCVGGWKSEFLIRKLTLQPLDETQARRISEEFAGVFPLTRQDNVPLQNAATDLVTPMNVVEVSEQGKLTILSAKYGVDNKLNDVAQKLAMAVSDGQLLLVVDDSLDAESAPSVANSKTLPRKTLRLQYRLGGLERLEIYEKNSVIRLDARPASSAKFPKSFKLIEARQGTGAYDPATWSDVSKLVRPYLKNEALAMNQDDIAKAIPAKAGDGKLGMPKSLFVRYQYDGQERLTIIPNGLPVALGNVQYAPGLIMLGFEGKDFQQQRLAQIESNINFDFGHEPPGPGLPADNFSLRWLGMLNVPKTDDYTLHLFHDDGARLWIDNVLLVDSWDKLIEDDVQLRLMKGPRVLRIELRDEATISKITLKWESESIPLQIIPASAFSHDPKMAKKLGVN